MDEEQLQGQDQEEQEEPKKFNLVEIVIMIMISLVADAISLTSILLVGVPVIGQVFLGLDWIFGISMGVIMFLWCWFKLGWQWKWGVTNIAGTALEALELPTRTITSAITIITTNYPPAMQVAQVVMSATHGNVSGAISGVQKLAKQGGGEEAAPEERPAEEKSPKQEIPETAFGMPEESLERVKRETTQEVVGTYKSEKGNGKDEAGGAPAPRTRDEADMAKRLGGAYEEEIKVREVLENIPAPEEPPQAAEDNVLDLRTRTRHSMARGEMPGEEGGGDASQKQKIVGIEAERLGGAYAEEAMLEKSLGEIPNPLEEKNGKNGILNKDNESELKKAA